MRVSREYGERRYLPVGFLGELTLTFRSRHLVHDSSWRGCWGCFFFLLASLTVSVLSVGRTFPVDEDELGGWIVIVS